MASYIDLTGILFAVFSFLSLLVLIPPFMYHCINKNIPAMSLIAWFSYKNLVGFINGVIWSGPDFASVTKAQGYCDVTVRISSGSNLGQLCATTCLIFNLYMVISAKSYKFLNADSTTKIVIDILMCWLNPLIVMGVSILAQAYRYVIVRYRGCTALFNYGFLSIVLSSLWNVIWVIIAFTFASLTIIEYIRKRRDLNDLLKCSNSGLNTRKFARLIVFSILIIVVLSPVVLIGFINDLDNAKASMNITSVSIGEPEWNQILIINEGSMPIIQRIIEIILSFCAFFLFGLGSEALKMYQQIFIKMGLTKREDSNVELDSEFYSFKKKSETIITETEVSELPSWYGPFACEHQVVSMAKQSSLSNGLSPTIQILDKPEKSSNDNRPW